MSILRFEESLENQVSGMHTKVTEAAFSLSLTDYRPHQREIITAALEGHDVFVQAGTPHHSRKLISHC